MITMNWMSDLEVRITAQTDKDVRDLRNVMNPYGVKKIVIEKCGLRLIDTAGFGKTLAEKEDEQRVIENQKARRAIDKMLNDLVKTGFLKREDYYGESLAAEENEQQLERNQVLKERLEEIAKEAKNDTLHG